MNAYDKAHETARALKESQQYRNYLKAKENLKQNDATWQMFVDFRNKQTELHKMLMAGEHPDEEKQKEIQRLSEVVRVSPLVTEFLKAEMDVIKVIDDIQRIVLSALDLELSN